MKKITLSDVVKKLNHVLCLTLLILFSGLMGFNIVPSSAWAQSSSLGQFTLTQACNATTSIKGNNPIPVSPGQSFEALNLNKEIDATHVLVKIPDTQSRWLALTCGQLSNQIATSPSEKPTLLPFFDDLDNPVLMKDGSLQDITPPAPILNEFDIAINELCSTPGTVVSEENFKNTLNQFPAVLANIKQTVGGSLESGGTSDEEFLDDLTRIWFNAHGFDHVFCGEPGKGIGGLHYVGRYLDLQEKGLAGILAGSEDKAEVLPGAIYTIGVVMLVGDRLVSSPIKGYAYTLNAEEILALGAKAYEDNPSSVPTTQACLLNVSDDGYNFENIFVTKNGAIRTFYSDATPDFTKDPECQVAG